MLNFALFLRNFLRILAGILRLFCGSFALALFLAGNFARFSGHFAHLFVSSIFLPKSGKTE